MLSPSLRCFILLLSALIVGSARAQTQITLDGTIGAPAGPVGPVAPGLWELPGSLGQRAGANLFYSFGRFSIGSGDTATFLPDPMDPTVLSNVIARVTDGDSSAIDGTLRSLIPDADLYLLNPAGVLFGRFAAIDVPRSLHVSTAHRLEFAGGSDALDLVDASSPTLSVAAPEAFGFIGGAPAGPIVFGNAGVGLRFYDVPSGETLTAVGGDVTVTGRTRVRAVGGRVQIAAVGSAAIEVPLDVSQLRVSPDAATVLGEVAVETTSAIDTFPTDPSTPTAPAGTVVIRGGRLVVNGRSFIRGGGQIAGTGPSVDIEIADRVVVSNQSDVRSNTQGALPSGGIRVLADSIDVSGESSVRSRAFVSAPAGNAPAGNVVLEAESIRIRSGGFVEATTDGPSAGGAVSIATEDLHLEDGEIRTVTRSTGTAGAIDIHATGDITIEGGAIASTSSATAFGGSIEIRADELELRGGGSQIVTTNDVTAPAPPGDADMPEGGIAIEAGSVRVLDGGLIGTQTSGTRAGGHISVAADTLEILDAGIDAGGDPRESAIEAGTSGAGAGGSIDLLVGDLRIGRSPGGDRAGRLATAVSSGATGAGGNIGLVADEVLLEGGGQISTTTFGVGDAGAVSIDATGDVVLRGENLVMGVVSPSGVFSRSETDADGNDISIRAANITVADGAEISARAAGSGSSGDVTLEVTDSVIVSGTGTLRSTVSARAVDGNGGTLTILAPEGSLEVLGGASVDVGTSGAGDSGELMVMARDVLVEGEGTTGAVTSPSSIAAQTDGAGDAGGVTIDASGRVRIGPGGRITALSLGLGGRAGDVVVDAGEIELEGGRITARSLSGDGGSVLLGADQAIRLLRGSEVTVEAVMDGNAGELRLEAPSIAVIDSRVTGRADLFGGNITLAGETIQLEDAVIDAVSDAGTLGPAAGNVTILGGDIAVNRSVINANGENNAAGGFVDITADALVISTDSSITATSDIGIDGVVRIDSPYGEVTSDLATLPENFLDASALLEEACLARDAPSGSFAVREVGALPDSPDAPLRAEGEDETDDPPGRCAR